MRGSPVSVQPEIICKEQPSLLRTHVALQHPRIESPRVGRPEDGSGREEWLGKQTSPKGRQSGQNSEVGEGQVELRGLF